MNWSLAVGPSWVSFLPKSSLGVAVLAELHRVSEATALGTCGLCSTEPVRGCLGAQRELPPAWAAGLWLPRALRDRSTLGTAQWSHLSSSPCSGWSSTHSSFSCSASASHPCSHGPCGTRLSPQCCSAKASNMYNLAWQKCCNLPKRFYDTVLQRTKGSFSYSNAQNQLAVF